MNKVRLMIYVEEKIFHRKEIMVDEDTAKRWEELPSWKLAGELGEHCSIQTIHDGEWYEAEFEYINED